MTLIVGVAVPDFGIIASDRRLTLSDGRLADDDSNKLVQFADIGAFGYTGVAEVAGTRTDAWLADVLASHVSAGLQGVLRAVRLGADKSFGTATPHVPQAFLGAFWGREEGQPPARPALFRTSNFHLDWDKVAPASGSKFHTHFRSLHEGPPLIAEVGVDIPKRLIVVFRRQVKARIARDRNGSDPRLAAEIESLMVGLIRDVAKTDKRVGQGVLTACIPHPAAQSRELFVTSGPPSSDGPTFHYYPPGVDDGWAYGPTLVTRGGVIMSDFRSGPIRPGDPLAGPDEGTDISVKIELRHQR